MSYSTIQEFKSRILKAGLLFDNHHFVQIIPPPAFTNVGNDVLTNLALLCETISLPGQNIATDDLRIYGENIAIPYMQLYEDVSMTFYVDGDMVVHNFFEKWMSVIFNKNTRQMGYPIDYLSTVIVDVKDKAGKVIKKVVLYECFPKNMAAIQMDYNSKNIMRLNVVFSVRYWVSTQIDTQGDETEPLSYDSQYKKGLDPTGAAAAGIGTASVEQGIGGNLSPVQSLTKVGQQFATNVPQAVKGVNAVMSTTSGLSSGLQSLNQSISTLAKPAIEFGGSLASLGQSLTNATIPLAGISNTAASIAGTVGSINGALNSLGVSTNLGKIQQSIATSAGVIGQLSNLNGFPQQLVSVGANISATGSIINNTVTQITNSKPIQTVLSKLGTTLSTSGNEVLEAGNNLYES